MRKKGATKKKWVRDSWRGICKHRLYLKHRLPCIFENFLLFVLPLFLSLFTHLQWNESDMGHRKTAATTTPLRINHAARFVCRASPIAPLSEIASIPFALCAFVNGSMWRPTALFAKAPSKHWSTTLSKTWIPTKNTAWLTRSLMPQSTILPRPRWSIDENLLGHGWNDGVHCIATYPPFYPIHPLSHPSHLSLSSNLTICQR